MNGGGAESSALFGQAHSCERFIDNSFLASTASEERSNDIPRNISIENTDIFEQGYDGDCGSEFLNEKGNGDASSMATNEKWETYVDDQGCVYHYCKLTGESVWANDWQQNEQFYEGEMVVDRWDQEAADSGQRTCARQGRDELSGMFFV